MILIVTAPPSVTRAKQHRANFFRSTKIGCHTCHAVTSHRDIEKYGFIRSIFSDMACRVGVLQLSHPSHSSYPDREAPPIRKTGIDPLSRVYNGRRSE